MPGTPERLAIPDWRTLPLSAGWGPLGSSMVGLASGGDGAGLVGHASTSACANAPASERRSHERTLSALTSIVAGCRNWYFARARVTVSSICSGTHMKMTKIDE